MKVPKFPVSPDDPQIPAVWSPSKLLKPLPVTNDLLGNPTWEEGQLRGERSLMVFSKASSVTVIAKVQTPPLKVVVSGHTFDEAMAALEVALASPQCPWQVDDNPLGAGIRKRK